jgi:hypothetical protein
MAAYTLKTRPPTGRVPWPLILIEGGEKSGKSWACAQFSASPRIGQMYWIDLAEGAADEYGAIPGADYLVVEHDGTWSQIYGAVLAIRDEARRAAEAGQRPVVLTIDSMTAEWDLHKDWASAKARQRHNDKARRHNKPQLADDVEPTISMDIWNEANSRHRRLMTALMTFPGIVLMTARGKEVAALDDAGKPIERQRDYRVEGHKNLGYDSSCWIRLDRTKPGIVVGVRSAFVGLRPGYDDPTELAKDWTIEGIVFDTLRCGGPGAQVRDLAPPRVTDEDLVDEARPTSAPPARPQPSPRARELFAAIVDAADEAALRGTWEALEAAATAGEVSQAEAKQLAGHVKRRKVELDPATPAPEPTGAGNGPIPMVNQAQHRRMHALWRDLGLGGTENREARLTQISMVVGRDVDTSSALTFAEAQQVIEWQERQRRTEIYAEPPAPQGERAELEMAS